MERKKNRDVKFIENSDMKKLDKLMGSLETDKNKPSELSALRDASNFKVSSLIGFWSKKNSN